MAGPLAGIRVLDLSRVLAGPWATQTLADLGADVIKVERPGTGDDTRGWGPPFVNGDGASAYFLSTNHGKRSITIDIGTDEGQALVREMAEKVDIVIENFKAGGAARMGFDYGALSAINPELIYCSITGFGQTGPYAERPGYDLLIQAMGGLMSLTGEPDGQPMKVGVAVTDLFTGMYAATAILAALHERSESGLGQYVDLSLFEVQIATLANQSYNYLVGGKTPQRRGNAHPNIVPYQAFEARDGYLVVAVGNDTQFGRFAAVIGHPELGDDPKFRTNASRVENREELVDLIAACMRQDTVAEWITRLDQAKVPAGPINNLDAVFSDPHVLQSGLVGTLSTSGGHMSAVNSPIHYSRSHMTQRDMPPELGAHTDDILRDMLGKDQDEIARLKAANVL